MAFIPIESPQDLRLGLYIKIQGSWFSHPFSKNAFKIKLQKDLETLQGLTKVRLLYDPDRSDPQTEHESVSEEATPYPRVNSASEVRISNDRESMALGQQPPPAHVTVYETPESRREAFLVRRKILRKTDQAYQAVLQQSKLMFQELRTGHSKAIVRASGMIESLNKIVSDPNSSMALMNLMSSPEEVEDFFMHSLNVCTLSMMLAQSFTDDAEDTQTIGIGALFHDIGLLEYERKTRDVKSYRTTLDSKTLREHPEEGNTIAEKFFGTASGCTHIIAHHHERLDGSGYPAGLRGEDIDFFTKIVMVVDEYDELCNHPDICKSLTPYEALCYLYGKRRGPLWDDAVVALVQMLSVYPPGSLVELSDSSLGVVSSINPQTRMAPWVMLYSQDIPREEACIIDLSQEENLAIARSLQPKDVPHNIRDYLNPRRIISYFPSQADEGQNTTLPERLYSAYSE
ncbi:MAG: DUF3391 domain-containing protein [Nitrospirales bacterium]|nr:DUF3391 domain-containing protein [Nitrospira sp.]MDR4501741.1 DUF3391 domain-containing protein [Nitrospirales bacterium]